MNKQLTTYGDFKHCQIWNFTADPEDQNFSRPSAVCERAILECKLRLTRKPKQVAMRFEHTQGNLNLNQDRYGVCIHEAGQTAVAFRLYDYDGHDECVVTNENSPYIKFNFSSHDPTPQARAVVALAGPVAEFKWTSVHDNFYVWCAKNRERASRRLDGESDLADDMTVALEEARKGEGPEQQLQFLEEWTVEAGSLVLEMWRDHSDCE